MSWENNKENVIPIVGGRPANCILHPIEGNTIQNSKNDFERLIVQEFDNKVRLLDIWSEYITWFEQVNLTGKNFKGHIERALNDLDQANEVFELDKYVKLWLKYASLLDQKDDIFQYLISSGIGFSNSILYTTYAYFCETSKDFRRAEEVYNLGLQRKAKPKTDLEQAYREFLKRLDTKPELPYRSETIQARTAFTDILLSSGKVAVDRVSHLTRPEPSNIHHIENNHQDQLVSSTGSMHSYRSGWKHPFIKSQAEKDNIMPPTQWEGVKLATGRLPSPAKSGISVHKIFQDKDIINFRRNRFHLLYPSTIPFTKEDGNRDPWLVATELENKIGDVEYSMEELMSLRLFHLKSSGVVHISNHIRVTFSLQPRGTPEDLRGLIWILEWTGSRRGDKIVNHPWSSHDQRGANFYKKQLLSPNPNRAHLRMEGPGSGFGMTKLRKYKTASGAPKTAISPTATELPQLRGWSWTLKWTESRWAIKLQTIWIEPWPERSKFLLKENAICKKPYGDREHKEHSRSLLS
ncbi:Mitotic checkpoint serine/threonine-protein kinase BUB1 beta [Thelohanellus kitauei]|uniref:Mitotic checkpoint serine/threonine-protein kinase BUB1 beta n=1 Tax=Thelohanellus kitauei TaxID=669202 RepID=A0A0C2JX79_THEKT|nr:Mitotic checkpoint serine/threonine-protein kinase BUB1 beta [Thelohanellus kitauei]